MAVQGACPPGGTRLTGTLGTTATAAGAAARDRTVQDPGELQLSCQALQSPEKLLSSVGLLGHLLSRPGPGPASSTYADWCWRPHPVPVGLAGS